MSEEDAFFSPEEVDRQIKDLRLTRTGDQIDEAMLTHLESFYRADEPQPEALERMWGRIVRSSFAQPALVQKEQSMQPSDLPYNPGPLGQGPRSRERKNILLKRLGMLAAALLLVALVSSVTIVFYAFQHNGGPAGPNTVPPTSPHQKALKVSSVDMTVTPASLNGLACGAPLTVTYTATFHVPAQSAGGTVQFSYTVNNGRSQTPATLTFAPGETTKSYNFTWSGNLPVDHTYPAPGGVQVSSPNQLISALVAPTGQCSSATGFQVTGVDMSVNPSSVQGIACGTNLTVTYTAVIHVAANSPGGTVQFTYTVNNGRGQTPASVTFAPGETTKSYNFTWSGQLPADHTYPGQGGIQVSSPNQLTSSTVAPTGQCSSSSAAAFQVTGVDMTVSPASIQGLACGTNLTVTYTATIHVAANSPGGTVQFTYTVNNGRGQTPASVTFAPGETTKSYNFTWSGQLPADHTYPGQGGIQVSSPNQLTSSTVAPTGQCSSSSAAAFQVTGVDMTVSPASIQGLACGTNLTVTYTATIHVAANSPGGTVQFSYTVNNGRGQTPASVTFAPGETTKSYNFTWSGQLPADHTYPGQGGIQVSSPNQLTSSTVAPTGTCS